MNDAKNNITLLKCIYDKSNNYVILSNTHLKYIFQKFLNI